MTIQFMNTFGDFMSFYIYHLVWIGVQRLARGRGHLFPYVGSKEAHIIPRRAFQTDADWEACYQFCRECVASAGRFGSAMEKPDEP